MCKQYNKYARSYQILLEFKLIIVQVKFRQSVGILQVVLWIVAITTSGLAFQDRVARRQS